MPAQERGMAPIAPFLPPKLAAFLAISCCKIHALVCIISLILLKFSLLLRLPGSNERLILPGQLQICCPDCPDPLSGSYCLIAVCCSGCPPGSNELLIAYVPPAPPIRLAPREPSGKAA